MTDNFEIVYNEETGCWEEKKDPYITIEILTEDDYKLLMKKIDFYDKNHDRIEQVKQAVKEFAESIIKELWDIGIDNNGKQFKCGDLTSKDIWRIAKKFGVEVEE